MAEDKGNLRPLHPLIVEHRTRWRDKPALRAVYGDFYRRMSAHMVDGRTLELGGGAGHSRDFFREAISTDILYAPWLDAVCDAGALPFDDGCFGNIVLLDVLHHLALPLDFLSEAVRVLRPGGRLITMDPAITPFSRPFYTWLHPERVEMAVDPLAMVEHTDSNDPFEANQAIPSLLFGRHRKRFEAVFPDFEFIMVSRLGFFAYPLCGGFRPWNLIPTAAVTPLLWLEDRIGPVLAPMMAFRLFVVLERRS